MVTKTAVIVGASGEIGLQIAKQFAKKDYSLALTYNSNKVDFKKELGENVSFKAYQLDLCDSEQIFDFFVEVAKDFPFVTTCVFAAGVAQKRNLLLDVHDDEIDNLFEVNIKSAIRCVREFAHMVDNQHPANVVLIGSFEEKDGCAGESVYASTKSALSGLCKSLASELGTCDIRINVVAPGFINTKMNNNLSQDEKEEVAAMTPLKRLGTTEDVANAVYFFASDESSFITGQTLFVDGGLVLQ